MKITKTFVLTTALTLSVLYNIYASFYTAEPTEERDITYSEREVPLGGIEIDTSMALRLIAEYREMHSREEIRGFLFSRKIFENIFKGESNTIAVYLIGRDATNLHLVLKGTKSENTGVTELLGTQIYLGQALCPYDCCEW